MIVLSGAIVTDKIEKYSEATAREGNERSQRGRVDGEDRP